MSLASRTGLFGVYSGFLVIANLAIISGLMALSKSDASASHLVLIPFGTLALLYRSRHEIFSSVEFEWMAGAGIILAGGAFLAAAYWSFDLGPATLTWFVAPLVILWAGGFVLLYGANAFRAALFPLLFLAFAIPVPPTVLDAIVRALTAGSSEVVAWLFALTGTPFHREGFVFSLPRLSIHIAAECSGIRSTIALFLTSLLAGHIYLRSSWAKVILALAVFPITVLKNGIRIVALSLLSIHVDPSFLEGRLHHDGGVAFFLLALMLLAPLLAFLRRAENVKPVPRQEPAARLA